MSRAWTRARIAGSRWGVRGAEDSGGGNRILFELENGFSSADGTLATSNTIFNRQAWVGAWGEVRAGRQYSPIYIPFKGQLDAFGAGIITSGLNNLSKITPYQSNAITYLSPCVYGVSMTLQAALRDGSTDGNGLDGDYRHGPFCVLYAHQQTNGDGILRSNLGGASYTYGKLTGFLAFFNGDGASVSALYAFAPDLRVSLGYTVCARPFRRRQRRRPAQRDVANTIYRSARCSMRARAGCAIAATRPSRCAA